MPGMDKDELKEVTKQAIKEWLDEMFAAFGKWSLAAIGASALATWAYLALKANGWTLK
jgi:hypothetical protein